MSCGARGGPWEQLAQAAPISLAELNADAALCTRIDRKYVVPWEAFARLLPDLCDTHRVLEIDGLRTFAYETIYFDSDTLGAYRAHLQRRRRRYKARSRRYVDNDLHFFEVKVKGPRGETVKEQLPYAATDHGRITPAAAAFLSDRLRAAYPQLEIPVLRPSVRTDYRRITFARGPARLTCDLDLSFAGAGGRVAELSPDHVILESKSERGLTAVDRRLRRLGLRPVACSKYCVGVGLLRDDVKLNELHWLLRRYFRHSQRALATAPADA